MIMNKQNGIIGLDITNSINICYDLIKMILFTDYRNIKCSIRHPFTRKNKLTFY